MKTLFTLFILLSSLSAQAQSFVQGIPDGSYLGKLRGQEKGEVHLIAQSYPGCEGCFLAILLDSDDIFDRKVQLVAYTALPLDRSIVDGITSSVQYSLTPVGVDSSGDVTLPNENPSLVLTIVKGIGTREAQFNIVSAQSDNHMGFNSSFLFAKEKESPFEIVNPVAGNYRLPGESKISATISQVSENAVDHSKNAYISWFGDIRNPGGNFLLRERMSNVYGFNAMTYLADGKKLNPITKKIVMFVKKGRKFHLLMVNPVDSRDVSCFYLKN